MMWEDFGLVSGNKGVDMFGFYFGRYKIIWLQQTI